MERIPASPPVILPLPDLQRRPRWSVMIPVYNCARYLPETLNAVLDQALAEYQMQIEVVDDASTDADIEALVTQIGKGRILYFRQSSNVGSLRNFETCINRARGELVHMLHGDDLVKPGYYQQIGQLFDQYPEVGAAFCRYAYIGETSKTLYLRDEEMDHPGMLDQWLLRLAERQRIQFCTITVKRTVYESVGSFYGVNYGEDWEMWMRIASRFPIAYTPAILAAYRLHYNSISGQSYASAQNLLDLQWVMQTIQQYLPDAAKEKLLKKSMKFYAHHALITANGLWHGHRNKQGARTQVKAALRMHQDPLLYWKITKLYGKMFLNISRPLRFNNNKYK